MLATTIDGGAWDTCEVDRASSARTTSRSGPFAILAHAARPALARVALTDGGVAWIDELDRAVAMNAAFEAARAVRPSAVLSAAEATAARLVVLPAEAATPPAGRVGYWTDGTRKVEVVALSAAGRRLVLESLDAFSLRSNVDRLDGEVAAARGTSALLLSLDGSDRDRSPSPLEADDEAEGRTQPPEVRAAVAGTRLALHFETRAARRRLRRLAGRLVSVTCGPARPPEALSSAEQFAMLFQRAVARVPRRGTVVRATLRAGRRADVCAVTDDGHVAATALPTAAGRAFVQDLEALGRLYDVAYGSLAPDGATRYRRRGDRRQEQGPGRRAALAGGHAPARRAGRGLDRRPARGHRRAVGVGPAPVDRRRGRRHPGRRHDLAAARLAAADLLAAANFLEWVTHPAARSARSLRMPYMSLRPLLTHLADDPSGPRFAREGGRAFVSASYRPYVIGALLDGLDGPMAGKPALVVAADDRQARDLAADLRHWLAPRPVRYYPSRGVAYESHLAPPPHLVGLRVGALDALLTAGDDASAAEPPVVVVSAVALSEKVPDPKLRPKSFALRVGDLIDLEETAGDLVAAGYERVDQVDDRGQFAIRGGLLDVYPATADHAVRVDLFDIEIESLRAFSTFTQRSLGELEELEIAPAAELSAEHRSAAEIAAITDADDRPDISELLPVDQFHPFLDLAPADAAVIIAEEAEVPGILEDNWQDVCTAFHAGDAHDLYVKPDAVEAALDARAHARLSAIAGDQPFEFRAQAADLAARSLREAEPQLEKQVRSGYRTVVTWPQRGAGERTAYNLARLKAHWLEGDGTETAPPGDLRFAVANLQNGFIAGGPRIAVIPEHRLFRRRRAERAEDGAGRARRRGALRSFSDLRTGEHVVHEDHGVARFAGFETKTVAGVTRDYLQLEFAGSDKVYMPVEQLAKISRYLGAGSGAPTLSKLGGKAWETMKARARRAAQELAGELLNLYAERRKRAGHAYPEDSEWLREFEEKFPFTETADQAEAIESVKTDMESATPMDRLICGDVGYGKTEVALRAAFKAADDGKQVLVLAPTTILAQQHYGNFAERLKDYPFTVDHVSRFRTPREQKEVVAAFNEGKVDILIGTHRLLGRDMRGKDIGLIVVDEEQRFGVKQKELLRQLKLKVDVIAMSATPIPRTLQMSMAGIRDISVIETPPEGRRPVKTYVGEYDEELVKQAIMREKNRGGQAFFVHNRVDTIDETAERLRGLCPGVSFEVAHGQLDEKELEKRMMGFLRGDADVLIATSIIESGIDIPQANTLIVERSDLFGLAQLYQIRGRVGRSRERAYAYLLYPAHAALTEEAMKRMSALSDYTELGAGFKIAMRDLEIRGAGNLLGDEQSGHVAALGFELYMQMLDEAVAEASAGSEGDEMPEPVRLDVNVDAYIPADYIAYEQAKIDVHRRIAGSREVADLGLLRDELEDRFGEIPQPLDNLLALQQARIKLGQAGARAVSFRGDRLAVTPIDLDAERAKRLKEALPDSLYEPGRAQLSVRVPKEPEQRFPAVVAAADALLAVASEAA